MVDALMSTRLKLVCRVLSNALAEGTISTYSVEFIDPATSTSTLMSSLKLSVGTAEVSQAISLPFSTRDTWAASAELLIQEFIDATCGNIFTDEEED